MLKKINLMTSTSLIFGNSRHVIMHKMPTAVPVGLGYFTWVNGERHESRRKSGTAQRSLPRFLSLASKPVLVSLEKTTQGSDAVGMS